MQELSQSFILFVKKLYQNFPQFNGMRLYLAGESFAGVYIPYIAKEIPENFNLQGLIICNGWIDTLVQSQAVIDFAVENNLLNGSYLVCIFLT